MKRVTDLSGSLHNIKTTDFEACNPSLKTFSDYSLQQALDWQIS